jgi:acyl dehydratase
MKVLTKTEEVMAAVGQRLGVTGWMSVDQDRVDAFADAPLDHQWIHVDVRRASTGPFGGTIAHGFLTLALAPSLGAEIFTFQTPGAIVYVVEIANAPGPACVAEALVLLVGQPG